MMKKTAIGLSVAALAIAGTAYAAPGDMRAKMDTDGNGTITRTEAQAATTAMFAKLDVNKDGKLDRADWSQRRQQMKAERFDQLDANNDGQLSRQEFTAGSDRARRDGKGSATAGRADKGQHAKAGPRDGHGGGMHHRGMMGMGRMADANNDGAVSQAEFTAAAMKHFEAADANNDGQVTAQEHQAMREQMKAKWQQMRAQKAQTQTTPN
ncbi:EF-hand domain-containing protein [Novosphingobium sp. M1R2S20]|uniref:EF-hand domain-containing protein n=1 Tax=Novosphingobium rhizovicinum TaxID=3228928 RepID=A0ABV3RAJ9_9SPHN